MSSGVSACDHHVGRVDFLIGFKHGMLDELVRVDQSSRYTVAQGQILAGTTRQLFDSFETTINSMACNLDLTATTWTRIHAVGIGQSIAGREPR